MKKYSMPNMEKTFTVSVVGETTNQRYEGTFRYKKPNLGTIRQIRCTKASLNEDFRNLDDDTLLMNEMLSWLSFTLLEHPTWWDNNGWDLYDYNVVMEVWQKVLEFERTFKTSIEEQGESVEDESKEKS